MKVKGIVVTALAVFQAWVQGQDYPLGARAQALGGSGVTFASDPEGQMLNPALLAELAGWSATAFYTHPFDVREIKLSSLSLRGSIGNIACGGAVVRLAHEAFSDQLYQFGLAHSFSVQKSRPAAGAAVDRFAIGVQAALREIRIPQYGQTRAWLVHLGCVARISGPLAWGVKLGNLFNATLGATREPVPRDMSLGLSYGPKPGTVFQCDAYKQADFPLEFRGGVEYRVLEPLSLRAGLGSNPDRLTFGMALWLRPVILHFAAFSHADLGWTQLYAVTLFNK